MCVWKIDTNQSLRRLEDYVSSTAGGNPMFYREYHKEHFRNKLFQRVRTRAHACAHTHTQARTEKLIHKRTFAYKKGKTLAAQAKKACGAVEV